MCPSLRTILQQTRAECSYTVHSQHKTVRVLYSVANRERECDKESFVEFLKSFCSLLNHEIKIKFVMGMGDGIFTFTLAFRKEIQTEEKRMVVLHG